MSDGLRDARLRLAAGSAGEEVRLTIRRIDGAWFVTSKDVPGLCAAHGDKATALRAAGVQLAKFLAGPRTRPGTS